MYCSHCGKELSENDRFCRYCGTENLYCTNTSPPPKIHTANFDNVNHIQNTANPSSQTQNTGNDFFHNIANVGLFFGIISVVCLILSVITGVFSDSIIVGIIGLLCIIFAILGIVLSALYLHYENWDLYENHGIAVAGLALSIIPLVMFFIGIIVLSII